MTPRTDNYHHGDLRRALIDAALEILEEEGADKLSLRAIARRVGVSQTAPYSHFANRDQLLGSVAAAGFRLFGESMTTEARRQGESGHLLGLGIGYMRFALAHPALYRLMFTGDRSTLALSEELAQASAASFEMIRSGVAQRLGNEDEDAAYAAWSMVHGLAELALAGRIELPKSRAALERRVGHILSFLF